MLKLLVAGAVLAVAAASTACTTATSTSPAPSTKPSSPQVASSTSVATVAPVPSGPTTAAKASSCPLISKQSAANRVGMRLDAITVLSSDGRTIGCRFYPLGHPNAQCDAQCLAAEHLPPASQPAVEITSARYATAADARTAVVGLERAGTNAEPTQLAAGLTGVCYQTTFYAKDHGQDWACAFNKNTVVVVVRAAQNDLSYDTAQVARGVAPKF